MGNVRYILKQMVRLLWVLSTLLVTLSACVVAAPATVSPTATGIGVQMETTVAMPTATTTITQTPTMAATPTPTTVLIPTETAVAMPTATAPVKGTATLLAATATPKPIKITPTPNSSSERYTVVNVFSDDVLNVRTLPGVVHPIVGTIPPYGMGVQITGTGQRVGNSLWVPIRYGEVTGWVNSHYLARQIGSADEAVARRAMVIVMALKRKDVETLSAYVHPDKGVRFSPYTYVRVDAGSPEDRDLVFQPAEIRDLFADPKVYHWGWFDGSGLPIDLAFGAYFARFVYDVDFARPHAVGYNEILGRGNTINNIADVYPQAVTVEYHFEGFDPKLEGIDWRSLRLVLEEKEGTWYLVGLVHDEWTI